jgi:16S rRNA U1498 N3-methylase RsmE
MPEGFDVATDEQMEKFDEIIHKSSYLGALKILGNKLCSEKLKKSTIARIERLEENIHILKN